MEANRPGLVNTLRSACTGVGPPGSPQPEHQAVLTSLPHLGTLEVWADAARISHQHLCPHLLPYRQACRTAHPTSHLQLSVNVSTPACWAGQWCCKHLRATGQALGLWGVALQGTAYVHSLQGMTVAWTCTQFNQKLPAEHSWSWRWTISLCWATTPKLATSPAQDTSCNSTCNLTDCLQRWSELGCYHLAKFTAASMECVQ